VTGLPASDCLVAAVATPLTADYRPHHGLLAQRCRALISAGCDGIALFGTTGEGSEFAARDRMAALDALLEGGLEPQRLVVSTGALAIPDVVELTAHATANGVAGVLVMPPCVYREGIVDDGTVRFYAAVIERVASAALRLYLYHFPAICGAPVTPAVVRRLCDRYPGLIAGIKDSGGDLDYTENLLRRFSHLAVMTGTEIHVPQALASGARGTICGLANVIPRLMRAMIDERRLADRRRFVPHIQAVDNALSRGSFIASIKAVTAAYEDVDAWRRMVPPSSELPLLDERRLVVDFRKLQSALPPDHQEATASGTRQAAD